MEGFVYALINPSLPSMVKVGRTTRDPEERARELSGTGVPTPFIVGFSVPVSDCESAERHAHELLNQQGFRVNKKREFFEAKLQDAIKVLIEVEARFPPEHPVELDKDEPDECSSSEQLSGQLFDRGFDYLLGRDGVFIDRHKAEQKFLEAERLGSVAGTYGLALLYDIPNTEVSDKNKAIEKFLACYEAGFLPLYCLRSLAELYIEVGPVQNAQIAYEKLLRDPELLRLFTDYESANPKMFTARDLEKWVKELQGTDIKFWDSTRIPDGKALAPPATLAEFWVESGLAKDRRWHETYFLLKPFLQDSGGPPSKYFGEIEDLHEGIRGLQDYFQHLSEGKVAFIELPMLQRYSPVLDGLVSADNLSEYMDRLDTAWDDSHPNFWFKYYEGGPEGEYVVEAYRVQYGASRDISWSWLEILVLPRENRGFRKNSWVWRGRGFDCSALIWYLNEQEVWVHVDLGPDSRFDGLIQTQEVNGWKASTILNDHPADVGDLKDFDIAVASFAELKKTSFARRVRARRVRIVRFAIIALTILALVYWLALKGN